MSQSEPLRADFRSPLGELLFLDRYALKTPDRQNLRAGQTVVFNPDPDGPKRRVIGTIKDTSVDGRRVTVEDRDNQSYELPVEYLDVPLELRYEQLAERVGNAVAKPEGNHGKDAYYGQEFASLLSNRELVPAGRILAGAGAPGDLTLYNCFVLPSPKDSRGGILKTAQEQFEIMSRGGGVGINVSSLRPRYDYVRGVNGRSSGSVSWADLYSIITGKVEQGGSRRGALMIILDCWHPDIELFIKSKHELGTLDNANISVGLTDDFMKAVEEDGMWDLVFPDRETENYDELWDGDLAKWKEAGLPVKRYTTLRARDLFHTICESAWRSAEPGLFFVDRVNKESNSQYLGNMRCTNPCGEQPLPGYGVCNLGALNLGRFVESNTHGHGFWPYEAADKAVALSRINLEGLKAATRTSVRFLDNVIDATKYVSEANEIQQKGERRVGLGVMGLAEMLLRAGVRYGSDLSVEVVDEVFRAIRDAAYETSIELSQEKGPFPNFDLKLLESDYAKRLPEHIREGIREHGLRNVTLLTVAPTGTTGSMMGTSTGLEPYFMFRFEQRSNVGNNIVEEPVVKEFREATGFADPKLPPQFVTTPELMPEDHIGIMATAQKYVDAAISKTMNLPNDYTVEQVEEFYRKLYDMGCKGGTVYRDGSREEQCLVAVTEESEVDSTVQPAQPEQQPAVKKLNDEPRIGRTISVQTHLGRCHVTLNQEPETYDFYEVFISLARGGSDIDADIGAIGRLISLILRLNSPVSARHRLELVADQLEGIASVGGAGINRDRTRSVPDAISKAIRKLLAHADEDERLIAAQAAQIEEAVEKMTEEVGETKSGFLKTCTECGNASAMHAGGCFECRVCGHAVCG